MSLKLHNLFASLLTCLNTSHRVLHSVSSGGKTKVKRDPTELPLFDVHANGEKQLQVYKVQLLTTIADIIADAGFSIPVCDFVGLVLLHLKDPRIKAFSK